MGHMKQFKQLVKELPAKKVVFTFGRFQPPTIVHGLLVSAVKLIAKKQNADHVIFASRSQDKKSNPLPVDRKVYYLKRMFPQTNFIGANENVRTFMEAAKELNKKYKNLVMVAGSDRVPEYKKLLEKYNGKDFHFDTIEVVSAGERDPDAEGATGMSGTKMRDAAKKGDFDSFKRGLPSTLTTVDAKRLMNEIREGLGLENIRERVELDKTSTREQYHAGNIFNVDDIVESNGVVYKIQKRGSNHLLLLDESGNLVSKWLQDVSPTNKNFTLLEGLTEMKFTGADKIKVARVIAGALGIDDVEKSSNPEMLINNALRKIRSKPMRPEYIEVLHKMLQTAKEAGISYDEKLVPKKAQVDEGAPTFDLPNPDRADKKGIAYNPHRKEKTADDLKKIATAKERDAKHTGMYKKQTKSQRSNIVKSYMDMLDKMGEAVIQPNGTDKVGDASAVLSTSGGAPEFVKVRVKKRKQYNENSEIISGLIEQIATAAMMNKDTTELKKKLSHVRHDTKNNESDKEAEHQDKPIERKIGHTMTAPHETDTSRKMKIHYRTEAVTTAGDVVKEDQTTAEYKVKTYYDNAQGKTVTRKIRPHRVSFKASKGDGEPEVDQPGEKLKNEAFANTIIPGTDISTKYNKVKKENAPDAFSAGPSIITKDLKDKLINKPALNLKEEEDEELTDSHLEDMANSVNDLDDIIHAYDDEELHIVDDEGEHVSDLKEETLDEVLSRTERIRAKVRFAQSQSKRERKTKVALRTPSSVATLNVRARKLAVKLMKERIARKPLDKLSVSEKERVEAIVQKRKAVVNRLAMKLVSRVKKIEQNRLQHKNKNKET